MDHKDCEIGESRLGKVYDLVSIESIRGMVHFIRFEKPIRVLSHGKLGWVEFEGIQKGEHDLDISGVSHQSLSHRLQRVF